MTVSVASHMGRRSSQQDRAAAFSLDLANGRNVRILMVLDGAGGHQGGEVASTLGLSVISGSLTSALVANEGIGPEDLPHIIRKALKEAHRSILRVASSNESLSGMASTAVVTAVLDDHAVVLWSGDSRCYLHRPSHIELLTRDHSVPQDLVRAGQLRPTEALFHPEGNVITSCLGHPSRLGMETRIVRLLPGTTLILGSDGMTEVFSGKDIAALVESNRSPPEGSSLAGVIADAAIRSGSQDNTTCLAYCHTASGCGWQASKTIVTGFDHELANMQYDVLRKEI